MKKLKLAYFGSPSFSAHLLDSLLKDKSLTSEITVVVTQPDKPVGKKHIITPSPVKIIAQKYAIPCWDKPILKEAGLREILKGVDMAIVYAYGFKELIPLELLEAPKIHFAVGQGKHSGFVNIHPSLLPFYRGASPIAYPILTGDELTGVSLFVMDEKMDHGPLVDQKPVKILNDVRPAMETLLTETGLSMIKQFITAVAEKLQNVTLTTQNHNKSTRAPYMVKDDGYVHPDTLQKVLKNEELTLPELPQILRAYLEKYGDAAVKEKKFGPNTIYDFWRGMYPWPGVWTKVSVSGNEKRLKITQMKLVNGMLSVTKVQLEGKKEIDFTTFRKAYGLF